MGAIRNRGFISLILATFFAMSEMAVTAEAAQHASSQSSQPKAADIARDPSDLPPPVGNRPAGVVHVTLTAREVVGELDAASRTTYRYWTFNGKVPGPFIRVRQGDTVVVTLQNDKNDTMVHSIDLHAALGPGGGAVLSQVPPGQSKTFSFEATTPGLFVYHCGTPMVAEHIANGMYGLILVEPAGGLPHADHEYYVMQGEIYTTAPRGKSGLQQFSNTNLTQETPEYYVYNGSVDATSGQYPLRADVGESVRIFFGNAGPNATASEHMIGEIFTNVYALGSLMSPPMADVQTTTVPPGGAAILEMKASMPGKFTMMDHAMSRMEKGLLAVLDVKGSTNAALMHAGPTAPAPRATELSGMTPADVEAASEGPALATYSPAETPSSTESMPGMAGMPARSSDSAAPSLPKFDLRAAVNSKDSLVGCMTELNDGKVMLKIFHSQRVYRLEAQPFLFSQNANRIVHVTGHFGSVLTVEDPHIPSFVVDDLDALAPSCAAHLSTADLQKALAPPTAPVGAVVGMGHMWFTPATVTITAGEQVVWKNTSDMYHNVVDNPGKGPNTMDASVPPGGAPFSSHLMEPGATFAHVFDKPGVYHYVCVLHANSGMRGTVIVKPGPMVASADSQVGHGR
jgi:copper-containing nitrite reductase